MAYLGERTDAGIDPRSVAVQVLDAIRNDELYVFTHPETRSQVDERYAAVTVAFYRANTRK